MSDEFTHFGEQTIPKSEKKGRVRAVFDSVAGRYDLMNDLMSGGVHRLWKDAMVDWVAPRPGWRILDVAGGTGDIAARLVRKSLKISRPGADVTICDINHEMLKAGAERTFPADVSDRLTRVTGDAETLPVADAAFDAYTVAFGVRNMTDMDAALAEAYRALKPAGRFVCLEFSKPTTDILDNIYRIYSNAIIPEIGARVANDRESYQYLIESIRKFPSQEEFAERIRAAGFKRVSYRNLTGGVAALHSAWRL